ncbi:hypothetical protein ACTA71_005386 [Dictyostelium dimigraforme]
MSLCLYVFMSLCIFIGKLGTISKVYKNSSTLEYDFYNSIVTLNFGQNLSTPLSSLPQNTQTLYIYESNIAVSNIQFQTTPVFDNPTFYQIKCSLSNVRFIITTKNLVSYVSIGNTQTGICICPITPHDWGGIDCSTPLHTISSASPSKTNGSIASIYGWFGNIHKGKRVFIGNQEAIIIPNIVFSNITILEGLPFNLYEYYIYGENLGGSRIPYNSVSDSIGTFSLLEVQQPNKLFKLTTYGQPSNPLKLSYSKSNPNYIFTLSFDNTPPQLNTVDWQSSTTDLIIDGSYFTYNSSIVTITIGDENCLVTSTTFYQIKCTLSNVIDSSLQDILSYITIGNLTTQFTLNPSVINTILNCTNNYNDCNGNGYCLSDIGKCKCYSNYQGDDCSLPYIECLPNDCNYGGVCNNITGKCQCDSNHQGNGCELPFKECLPNDCNGNGICKNTTGECQCDSNHQGSDCNIPYVECLPNDCNNGGVFTNTTGKCQCDSNHQGNSCELPFKECLNQCNNNLGKCNNQTGICTCPINPHAWSGIDCSIPLHTISGAAPSNTNGGIASIYGWFGNIHTGKQVFIGNQECTPIYNFTETEIICNSPAGTGLKSISVIQNSINVTSKDIYQYYSNDKQCPNHCTSTLNGICNSTTGYCNCIGRWSGYDCSLYSNPRGGSNNNNNNNGLPISNTTIDNNTGNTNINNQQTNF